MTKMILIIKRFIVFVAAFLLNILLWSWLFFFIKPTGDSQVLHYNIYFGIDQIGPGIKLYLLPIFGLLVIGINLLLSISKHATKRLIIYASWLALCIQIFLGISLVLLIINHF